MVVLKEVAEVSLSHAVRGDLSDAHLVEAVRQGDRSAFGDLVKRYEKKLLRTIYRMVASLETAEDLVQEAFLRAYDRLDRFDSSRRFGPWLFQIGVNGAIDWLRRNRKRKTIQLSELSRTDGDFDVSDPDPRPTEDLGQEVQFVLEQIPLEYRTVLMLRDLEGFPCSEVAGIIGRREPTVRWRLLRAREMFRDIWQRRENEKTVK